MQFNIVVKGKSEVETIKKGKNTYQILEITYDKDGKEEKRKLVSFNHPDVFSAANDLNSGDFALVTVEKEGDYWQWTKVEKRGAGVAQPAEAAKRGAGTYETGEERAKRQIYIVRQSSLSNAIEYFKLTEAKKVTPEEIELLARQFENFVFGEQE